MLVATAGVVAFAVTLAAAPVARHGLLRLDMLDRPNHRSSHAVPVARGGGIACALGVTTGVIASAAGGGEVPWAAAAIALAVAVVGLLDDRLQLPAAPRLALQVTAGATLGLLLGGPLWWALIGAAAMPLVVNVVNFMDGINGITALNLTIWGVAAALLGIGNAVPALSLIGAVTAGAALGFFPWNGRRARLFLGDVGSYLFGALAASGILLGASQGVSPLALGAPLAIYLADVTYALSRRALRGEPLMEAHRSHIYQRLATSAGSHVPVAMTTAGLATAAAVVAHTMPIGVAALLIGGIVTFYLLLPHAMNRKTSIGVTVVKVRPVQ